MSARSVITMNSQGCVFPPLGALVAASSILSMASLGTGSGLYRVIWGRLSMASNSPSSAMGARFLRRDSVSSIAYSEELISDTMSATLQSTDRHYGIVDQEPDHFQLDS